MKNNRRIELDKSFLVEYKLSTAPPPANSLFWKMWDDCMQIADDALNTDFIQGIADGTLDPVTYGGFNVSDAYYCFNGEQDYLTAAEKATNPGLQAFLLKKHKSYQKYNKTFPDIWHIKDANGIVPSKACKEYAEYESNVVSQMQSIYALIVMIPCEYLWAWLGNQLTPPETGNLYAPWITGNDDFEGAYAMGNFLNEYQKKHVINESIAIDIYTKAMTYEYLNFMTATKTKFNTQLL